MSFTPSALTGLVRVLLLAASCSWASVLAEAPRPAQGVLLERGYLPDAKPNAFAVGFSNGVSFCYDPVRGGLNYAWTGGFVDVTPIRPGLGKNLAPMTLAGPVVYREAGEAPLRIGDARRKVELRFLGYDVGEDRIEFLYSVGGNAVREEIRPRAGGGIVRRFRFSEAPGPIWYFPGTREGAGLIVKEAVPEAGGFRVTEGANRDFTIEVVFPEAKQ